jgi:hypothetical protein
MAINVDAYELFKRGLDTFEIANIMQKSEAEVLRAINVARAKARDLPCPYRGFKAPTDWRAA